MSFLLFDIRNDPVPLSDNALKEVVTRIDRDYPPYVKQLPCILDVQSRKLYNGSQECAEYLAQFEPKSNHIEAVAEPPKPVPEPIKVEEPIHEEPKKKVVRRRAQKAAVVIPAAEPVQEEPVAIQEPQDAQDTKTSQASETNEASVTNDASETNEEKKVLE